MEDSMVAAYIALLLGYVVMKNEVYAVFLYILNIFTPLHRYSFYLGIRISSKKSYSGEKIYPDDSGP